MNVAGDKEIDTLGEHRSGILYILIDEGVQVMQGILSEGPAGIGYLFCQPLAHCRGDQPTEQEGAGTAADNAPEDAIGPVILCQSITVYAEETMIVQFDLHGIEMDDDAQLIFQERSQPEIMVSGDVMDLDTRLGQFSQLLIHPPVFLDDDRAPFKIEIKEIPDDDEGRLLCTHLVQQTEQFISAYLLIALNFHGEMNVRDEVGGLHGAKVTRSTCFNQSFVPILSQDGEAFDKRVTFMYFADYGWNLCAETGVEKT